MPSLLDGHIAQQRSVILSSFHALPPPPRRNSLFVSESVEKGDAELSPEGGEEKDFSSKQPIDREERGDSLVNREDSLVEDESSSLLTDKDEASSPPKKPTSPAEKRPAQEATVNEESQHIRETTANDEKRQKMQEPQNTVLQGICSHLRQHGQELPHRLQQEQLLPPTATVDTVTPEVLA